MYKVVGGENIEELEEMVNTLLTDGYVPAGGVQVKFVSGTRGLYQAMWKKAKVQKQAASAEYSTMFLGAWIAYPKRAGSNSKKDAWSSWKARCRDASEQFGTVLEVDRAKLAMVEGARRYLKFCEETGKVGTEYVMQAATFFGPSQHYLEDWAKPEPESERGVPRKDEEIESWARFHGYRVARAGESFAEYRRYLQTKLKEEKE